MAGDGVKIISVIVLMFIGMYLYAISSNLIADAREMRAMKKKLRKEQKLKEERIKKDEFRAEKRRLIKKRSDEIRKEFAWLDEINKKIKKKAEDRQEKISQ